MSWVAWGLLTLAAFATAALSAVVGFGGGIVLLGTMLLFLPVATANATHAAVQLVSNVTRLSVFARHISWGVVAGYGAAAGVGVATCGLVILDVYRPENRPYLLGGIGACILLATFAPRRQQGGAPTEGSSAPRWWWPALGLVAGFLGPIVGATGPLTAPFFLRAGLLKERLIATKAACQAWVHLLKLGLFALVGRQIGLLEGISVPALLVLGMAVLAGTLWGKRLLRRIGPDLFVRIFQVVVTVIAVKLILADCLWPLLATLRASRG